MEEIEEKELFNGHYGYLTMVLKQTNDKIIELENKEAKVSDLIVIQELIEHLKDLQKSLVQCMIDYRKTKKIIKSK